ncbi:MAG: EF-P lysine aminoacylase GenX, partial [Desulfobulbaceae bacterium]|nr:EF-P lysine aminoacylase GenX [Desulfobulbaceae bacterium]
HRFTGEIAAIRGRGDTAAMPEPFLADLERLGDMAGIALGLDRLFMLLQGCATLDEAQTFSCGEL